MRIEQLVSLIGELAEIPSFSSYEDILHPCILEKTKELSGLNIHRIADHNLVLEISGTEGVKPVALAAHLDKINHFGENPPEKLPFKEGEAYLEGQMDDSVGLGICLGLALQSRNEKFPPLLVLLSEMEESFGLKQHPHLMRNHGKGLHHGIGAERISKFLKKENMLPECVITLDTTPLFKGDSGVAIYSKHWQYTKSQPSQAEILSTLALTNQFLEHSPDLLLSNNTNDYLTYGKCLNQNSTDAVPSIAIEPAIFPYHQKNERVFKKDIENVYQLVKSYLLSVSADVS
ncbi:MAG: hypothetical protein WD267_11765 [Balneolales bacterium]